VSVTGSLNVSGTWIANSDGTYTDNTTTSGVEQLALAPECLTVSGTTTSCDRIGGLLQGLGYAANCASAASGGCTCSGTVRQAGGIGVVSGAPSTSGSFSTSGNTITIDSTTPYSYCVSADKMTWTPQPTSPTMTGTVVLQSGSTGSGGASGSGAIGGGGGATSGGGATGTAGSSGAAGSGGLQGPCDIYAASNTPCVAAFSTVRVLSSKYVGPLYQVRKGGSPTGTGGTTQDIGVVAGNYADGAAQDAFCGTSACTISKLYDQSGKANDLTVAPAGCYVKTADNESDAKARSLTINGHKAYALYMVAKEGYRNDRATGLPMGTAAQGIYEIADGKRIGAGCCWDFGNAKPDNCYGATGTMNTVYFGTGLVWGKGAGKGPWFMADFEAGVWAGGYGAATAVNNNLPSSTADYAFGIVKTNTINNTPQYAIRVGDAQSGGLTTAYDGRAPGTWQMQGALLLGIGGDNSNGSLGTFFEGAVTAGRPSDDTDLAVLQNTQAAGYGK
jgi:Alpha-L-arabinofuranosidase B, catalytic